MLGNLNIEYSQIDMLPGFLYTHTKSLFALERKASCSNGVGVPFEMALGYVMS